MAGQPADAPGDELGLDKSRVVVVEHDARWAARFDETKAQLAAALTPLEVDAEIAHVGSTAVPHLRAKPVLDIAVGLGSPVETTELSNALLEVSFVFQDDLGDYGGRFYTREPVAGSSDAHIHVVSRNNFQWPCYLMFRDELRTNEQLRAEYGTLKTRLAVAFRRDRPGYSKAKSEFVFSTVSGLAAEQGIDVPRH